MNGDLPPRYGKLRLMCWVCCVLLGLSAVLAPTACLAQSADVPSHRPLAMKRPLEDGNFYLLTLLQASPKVYAALLAAPGASPLSAARATDASSQSGAAAQASEAVTKDVGIQRFLLADKDVAAMGETLREVYRTNEATISRSTSLP